MNVDVDSCEYLKILAGAHTQFLFFARSHFKLFIIIGWKEREREREKSAVKNDEIQYKIIFYYNMAEKYALIIT